ncbi:High-molecular weight cobalt-containing nitrile hydratase subunit beta [bacterium HR40]|nr:High-molecular weight cobalt-containing nitrile hydratase subunit beta [bacterium HR40]
MTAALRPGMRVRVRRWDPPGHVRTPFYTRGKIGEVVAEIGPMPNPEHLAYGRHDRPPVRFYRVAFPAGGLWSNATFPDDLVIVDLAEHWLEPLEQQP